VLIIHSTWVFTYGILVSAVSCVVFGLFVIYYVASRWNLSTINLGFTRFGLCKFLFLLIIVLGIQGVLVWYQTSLLQIHVKAPDPEWVDFPLNCSPNPYNVTILNCFRVGPDPSVGTSILNPYSNNNADSSFRIHGFNASRISVQNMFEQIVTKEVGCKLLWVNSTLGFLHFRCLTTFQGYPDDLAFKFFCNSQKNITYAWIHSQSRLGIWDFNFNDARVRQVMAFMDLYYIQHLPFGICN